MEPPSAPAAPARDAHHALPLGAWSGAVGGLAAGAIDAIWSWSAAEQFAAGFTERLRLVGFCACAYALAGALAAVAITAAARLLVRGTRLGELARFALDAHEQRRRQDPGAAVTGLALVLVGLPALVIAAVVAHRLALPMMARRNPSLVVAVIMLDTVGALLAAGVITLLLSRQLEHPLAILARRPRWRALSSATTPLVTAAALFGVAGLLLLRREWETVRLLPVRPAAAVAGIAALALAARPSVTRLVRATAGWRRRRRWLAAVTAIVAMIAGSLRFGASPAIIKAATAYSGLGGPIAALGRRAFDRDRDGYSRVLGGGDCDDGDPRIHPGAAEVPDDDIDQNCVAGDAISPPLHPLRAGAPHRLVERPPAAPASPNILLITIDTLRADHLGAYGYPRATSPALDRLAAEGTLFQHSWAHAPSTRYSMPAILTGRLPLDVWYDTSISGWPGLAPRATTLAEVLKALGLFTGAITNYWYFDRGRGLDQGFDEYDNDDARLHTSVPGAGPAETQGSSSREQTDKAIAFVERHLGQRWFLWVHYYDPHYAYEPHPGSTAFGDARLDRYDGEIRFTDDQIGRLFEELRRRGLYDRTVIAVTGDHGEGFGEHGVELHGYHLYTAQTKVPLIVRVPGLPPRRSTTPAGHVDLLPTLANLAGLTPTARPRPDEASAPGPTEARAGADLLADAMGESLVDVLAGAPDRDRVIWQQLSYEGRHELRGAVSAACHVLYNISPSTSWEVYRLEEDPGERRDLAATSACADTRRALAHWYDASSVPAGALAALLPDAPTLPSTLDVELGPAVRLLAVTAPARAHPGDIVELTWTFAALGEVPAGWQMFVHAEGPGRFSGDHAPARPFEWWRRGQFIRYSTQLVVPRHAAAGTYTIWAGMWRGAQRMPVRSAKVRVDRDRAAVATLEVVP